MALASCSSDPAALVERKCVPCHVKWDELMDQSAPKYETVDDWRAMVADMQLQTDTIAQYLYDTYTAASEG